MSEKLVRVKDVYPKETSHSSTAVQYARVLSHTGVFSDQTDYELILNELDRELAGVDYTEQTWYYDSDTGIGSDTALADAFDIQKIAESLKVLANVYPWLGGVITQDRHDQSGIRSCIVPSNKVREDSFGRKSNYQGGILLLEVEIDGMRASEARHQPHNNNEKFRRGLAVIPPPAAVVEGKAPLMTVTITRFAQGGYAVGVGLSHGLVDGTGTYVLLSQWFAIHKALVLGDPERRDELMLSASSRAWSSQRPRYELNDEERDGLVMKHRWLNLHRRRGRFLARAIPSLFETFKKTRATRADIFFSKEEVKKIFTAAPRVGVDREDTLSPNMSLFASLIACILTSMLPKYNDTEWQLLMPLQFRGDRSHEIPSDYLGNAISIGNTLVGGKNKDSKQSPPESEIAGVAMARQLHQTIADALHELVKDLRAGKDNPTSEAWEAGMRLKNAGKANYLMGIDPDKPFFMLNNLGFSLQGEAASLVPTCQPIGFTPHNQGEHIQICRDIEGKGVRALIGLDDLPGCPKDWFERISSAEFKSRVLAATLDT